MNISIHALREEGDRSSTTKAPTGTISIHALREEGDGKESSSPQPSTDFYPRPPRGGRPPKIKNPPMLQTISIHALREEGDPKPDHEWPGIHVISIHALREEGDQSFQFAMQTVK